MAPVNVLIVRSNFEIFLLMTTTFLMSTLTSAEPHYGYAYQKPKVVFNTPNYYQNTNSYDRRQFVSSNHMPHFTSQQAINIIQNPNTGRPIRKYEVKQPRMYHIPQQTNMGWQNLKVNQRVGNLYDSMKTSYDVPIIPLEHATVNEHTNIPVQHTTAPSEDVTKNYDVAEYQQILNNIFHKDNYHNYILPINNGGNSHNRVDKLDHVGSSDILDGNLLRIIEDILINEENKSSNIVKPHPVYGNAIRKPKVVGIKWDAPIKSIPIKQYIST